MSDALTPMMQQYHRLKREIPPDAMLLFRLGDFYEMFFADAEEGSRLLDLTLTQRQGTPMCGMPYHAAEGYIAQILKAGRRVAICDQMEAPRPGQVVRREITQILTPGSILDAGQLEPKQNNFLAAIAPAVGSSFGVAALDLTTGEFFAGEFATPEALRDAIGRVNPAEVVVAQGHKIDLETSALSNSERLTYLLVEHDAWSFSADAAEHTLRDHFKTASLDGFGLTGSSGALCAAGGLLHYLGHELRRSLGHVHTLRLWQREDVLILDAATRRNLELVDPLRPSAGETTLLSAVDRTVTSGGGRLLRQMVARAVARRRRDRAPPKRRRVGEEESAGAKCVAGTAAAGARCGAARGAARTGKRQRARPDRAAGLAPATARLARARSKNIRSPRCANWAGRSLPCPSWQCFIRARSRTIHQFCSRRAVSFAPGITPGLRNYAPLRSRGRNGWLISSVVSRNEPASALLRCATIRSSVIT